jgi:hypothetical protein
MLNLDLKSGNYCGIHFRGNWWNGPKFRPKGAGMTSYDAVFQHSIKNPEEFWAEAAKVSLGIRNTTKFLTPPTAILQAGFPAEK